jgi:hypothetical protein
MMCTPRFSLHWFVHIALRTLSSNMTMLVTCVAPLVIRTVSFRIGKHKEPELPVRWAFSLPPIFAVSSQRSLLIGLLPESTFHLDRTFDGTESRCL